MSAAVASPTSGPPIMTINGDNPATIQIGATYHDLGAKNYRARIPHKPRPHHSLDGATATTASFTAHEHAARQLPFRNPRATPARICVTYRLEIRDLQFANLVHSLTK
jgi:hypothetical protein